MAMHTIRTTQQPGVQITVDEAEYQQLFAWGLIYNGTAPLTPADFYDSEIADRVTNGTATPAALRAAFVPFWAAAETVTAGTVRVDSTGHLITRNANGTTRATYDATEQAAWTVTSSGGGGGGAVSSVAGRTGVVVLSSTDLSDSTATGRSLVTAASAAAARTTLGLAPVATSGAYADLSGKPAARAPYLGPVGTRGRIPTGVVASSIYKQMMTWSRHVATDDISALSLLYSTINGVGEVAVSAGPGQVTASVEYPMGTFTQVTFGGSATGTLPTTDHMVSDLTTLTTAIPAGATFWIGTWVNWTGTNSAVMMDAEYTNLPVAITRETSQASTTTVVDTTMTGARNSGATNARDSYRPSAILGMTTRPTFLLTGDSRTRAGLAWELNADSYGLQGLTENVLGGRYGYINVGVGTDTYTNALSGAGNNYIKRGALAAYCTHILDDYGINSVWADSSATHQANVTAFRQKFPGKVYFKTTLIPQLTGTSTQIAADGSDQTPLSTLSLYVTNNNWVRQGGAGIIDGYVELEDLVTLKRDSGKFLPAERSVSDAAMTSGSNVLTSATANFTTSDLLKGIQVKGAGAAGATLYAFIKAVTNATTITLGQLGQTGSNLNASTTVSAAQAGIGVMSLDNTHQSIRLEAIVRNSTAVRALSMVK